MLRCKINQIFLNIIHKKSIAFERNLSNVKKTKTSENNFFFQNSRPKIVIVF